MKFIDTAAVIAIAAITFTVCHYVMGGSIDGSLFGTVVAVGVHLANKGAEK